MKSSGESDLLLIQRFAGKLQGVFKLSDLQIILKSENPEKLHNRINRLAKAGAIRRFSKGIYLTESFSAELLSSAINPDAYLSMGTVLAKHGLIGTVPEKRIIAVKLGRNRRYGRGDLTVEHFGISERLYFGFSEVDGIKIADCEKAFIDALYYHMKGRRFSFNPAADIDVGRLDGDRVEKYLAKYRNRRFVEFCRSVRHG